jgi:NTE family protein
MSVFTFRSRRFEDSGPKVRSAFVLGGGGNLGAIQVGMLRALIDRGIVPDEIYGCSVGAINAVALAGDPTPPGVAELADIWSHLDSNVICSPGRLPAVLLLTRRYRSLQSNESLRKLLETTIQYKRLEDAPVPVSVVATSLRTGRDRWFDRGPVVDAVLASAALPAVFPPVEIGGEPFVDGGVVDNVPIGRAVGSGARRVYVLHVGNFQRPRPEPKRPIDALLQSFSIARNYRFQQDIDNAPPGVELIVLPSIDPGAVRPNDFSKSASLIARAHAAAASFLDTRHESVSIG